MEDLAKFFADIIEFVVGGVFFLASLLLLANAIAPDAMESLYDDLKHAPDGFNGVYALAAVAVVYAMGIVAEGVSRVIFERRLDTLTRDKFHQHDQLPVKAASKAGQPDLRADPWFPEQRAWLRELRKRFARSDRELIDRCVELRERWRIESVDHGLTVPIDYQLKRLRIERTLALSSAIAAVGLLASHLGLAFLLVACTVLGYYLVNERFQRFLSAIARCHAQVRERIAEQERIAAKSALANQGEAA